MNRRTMLTATVGVLGTSAMAPAQLRAGGRIEVRTTSKKGEAPYALEEFNAMNQSQGAVRSDDRKGLSLVLKRTFKDPTAPRELLFVILDGSNLMPVLEAARSCAEAGYAQLKLTGCIPPGCGLPAGAPPNPKRHNQDGMETARLIQILELHSTFC
jgi:hypothetical protein